LAKQKKLQQYIFKINSTLLRKNNWDLSLPLNRARKTTGLVVALADSQILSWINELNGTEDYDIQAKEIQRQIKDIKKEPVSRSNKTKIANLYQQLYRLQFKEDYLCVIIDKKSDYDRANQGFYVNGIKYLRLICTTGGVKTSTVVYVSEKVHAELKKRIENGKNNEVKLVPAKLGAYEALAASGSLEVSWPKDKYAPIPGGVIVVRDAFTEFCADLINIDDSDRTKEPVVQFSPNQSVRNDCSDGCSMMLPSLSKRWNGELNDDYEHTMSGCNLRCAWTKGMTFTFDYIKFAEEVVGASEDCPEKYLITDIWGQQRDIRDSELIITESQLKLWSCYDSWEDYYNKCLENKYTIRVAKTAPHEVDDIRQLNYQFIQSLNLSDEDVQDLIAPTVNEIKDIIGLDPRKSIVYLCGKNLNDSSIQHADNAARALMANPESIKDPYIRNRIKKMINKRIREAKIGVLDVHGNFQIISGDLYALCESMFGLEVHGLLKAGEIYSKYWKEHNVKRVMCARAPMSNEHSLVSQDICYDDKVEYWFKYMDTVAVVNAWDTMPMALNGFDFDGDLIFTTDNQALLRNQTNLPALNCIQYNASKKVVTEEDVIKANKDGFGSKIGSITNRITAITSLMANYEPGSVEYETLRYRTQCGQALQQEEIDKAKGILPNPMPKTWYIFSENRIKDDDSEAIIAQKTLNQQLCAHKKPYFFGYNYPTLKQEYDKFVRETDEHIYSVTGKNVRDLLKNDGKLPENEQKILDFYKNKLPLDVSPSTMNRICWAIEDKFDHVDDFERVIFDYTIYKSGIKYSGVDYEMIKSKCVEYKQKKKEINKKKFVDHDDCEESTTDQILKLNADLEEACFSICSNEQYLCEILLDLCYRDGFDTSIVWNLCGSVVVDKLAQKSHKFSYPVRNNCGDFWCCGSNFSMKDVIVGGENND
jgi:hypothetical protein